MPAGRRSTGSIQTSPRCGQDPHLESILRKRIAARLEHFPGHAKIPRVAVVERPWSIEDGTMTPTMKLKRNLILAQYHDEVEWLYAGHV
jgi:long-chain acyl-CoA synthetase